MDAQAFIDGTVHGAHPTFAECFKDAITIMEYRISFQGHNTTLSSGKF
jgi:hypothetical protein